ncbi:MAG: hypothetical protein ACI9EW_002940 [Cellvibrionaceae bacterium]|jgi:hypothetical protein
MLENLNTLEEKIEKPGYLLFLVVSLLFMIIGFVNVISFEGYGNPILGKFSIIHMGMVLFMIVLIIPIIGLLKRPNNDSWLQSLLGYIANWPIAIIGMLAVYSAIFWHMFTADTWLFLPVLQFAFLAIMIIFAAMVLLHKWDGDPKPGLFRRGLVYLFGALIVIEVVVQLLALASALPSLTSNESGLAPRDRIYINGPNGTNDTVANSNGFNYPDFRLEDDSYRVVFLGDRAVQALEIPSAENMGVLADQMLVDSGKNGGNAEVFSMGFQDLGSYIYLDVPFWVIFEDPFEPDEIIVFIDFNNDFQLISESDGAKPYFYFEGDELTLSDVDFWMRHDQLHGSLWGLEGFQPRRFFSSHILTLRLARKYLTTDSVFTSKLVPAPQEDIVLPNSFIFYEEQNDHEMAVLMAQIDLFLANAQKKGIKVSLVTIPVFPTAFYEQADSENWTMQFGDADLALPEAELISHAAEAGISILTMSDYMRQAGLSTGDINELYFDVTDGGLTTEGHAVFAEAVFQCFFSATLDSNSGCNLASSN